MPVPLLFLGVGVHTEPEKEKGWTAHTQMTLKGDMRHVAVINLATGYA